MTRSEMIAALRAIGFGFQRTASKKWKVSLFKCNGKETLFVLVRSRGVDILITPVDRESMLNPNGTLSVSMQRDGDRSVEYNYTQSNQDVHGRVLEVSRKFTQGSNVSESYFTRIGIGRREWASQYGNNSTATSELDSDGSITDIYDAISSGDGEPAYLGDGIWIGPGGSVRDRGR